MVVFYYAYASQPQPKIDVPKLSKEFGEGVKDKISFYMPQEIPQQVESQFTNDALADYYNLAIKKVMNFKTEAELLAQIEEDFKETLDETCRLQGDYHFDRNAYGGVGGCVQNNPTDPENPEIQDQQLVEQTQKAVEEKKLEILEAELSSGTVNRNDSGLSFTPSTLTVNGKPVYYRGDIVSVIGQITKETSPPYTYNIIVTCCGMSSVKSNSHVETNADGSFTYSFATWSKYPLGEYTAEVSTLSSDNKSIMKYSFEFVLRDRQT